MAVSISLQDVKEKFELLDEQLHTSLSDEHLREASKIIADHETLGQELGITGAEMAVINEQPPEKKRTAGHTCPGKN